LKPLSQRAYHVLFVTPALLLSVAIVLLPALLTFGASFSRWDGVSAPAFVGLDNFEALFADNVFWAAITNNIQWALIFLTIPMAIALVAASLLLSRRKSGAVYQVIFLLPYVLAPVANAVIWQNIILSPVDNDVSRNFYARKMFMGAQGIGPHGIMEADPLLIQAEQKLISQADELYLLVDSSKFRVRSSLILCPLERIHTVITDRGLRDTDRLMLETAGIRVIVAAAGEEETAQDAQSVA